MYSPRHSPPPRRLLAFVLSRYGDSSNAPIRRDAQSAYADAAPNFLGHTKVKDVIVLEWSLHGCLAIEMLDKLTQPERGLMIIGTRSTLGGEEV
jgi:hypothetical protein